MWDAQWDPLVEDHDVVRPDLRGSGESSSLPEGPLSDVDDVARLLDTLGMARCHVIGASFGAGVATELALTRPDLVRSLLLCPPGGSLLALRTPDLQAFADAENAALERGDLAAAVEANVETWVVGPGRGEADVDARVLDAVRLMQRRAFEIQAGWGEGHEQTELDPPALERLGDVRCPVHVLVGGHDLDTCIDAADRISVGVPGAVRTTWPDAAHLPSMEHPGRFLQLVRAWTSST
jgi:3-oxoadipate enol-lactonase